MNTWQQIFKEQEKQNMIQEAKETERTILLMEANEIVNKDRNSNYGNPEDNFRDIAHLWSVYKGVTMTPMDVAIFCTLIKVARLKKNPMHRDSLVDIAGYAACGADIQKWMNEGNAQTPKPSAAAQQAINPKYLFDPQTGATTRLT